MWTIDLKKNGVILKGLASPKADVTLIMSDDTFSQLAAGKVCIIVNPCRRESLIIVIRGKIDGRSESFPHWQAEGKG